MLIVLGAVYRRRVAGWLVRAGGGPLSHRKLALANRLSFSTGPRSDRSPNYGNGSASGGPDGSPDGRLASLTRAHSNRLSPLAYYATVGYYPGGGVTGGSDMRVTPEPSNFSAPNFDYRHPAAGPQPWEPPARIVTQGSMGSGGILGGGSHEGGDVARGSANSQAAVAAARAAAANGTNGTNGHHHAAAAAAAAAQELSRHGSRSGSSSSSVSKGPPKEAPKLIRALIQIIVVGDSKSKEQMCVCLMSL